MPPPDDEPDDAVVPALAVLGLLAATRRTVEAGLPRVIVQDGQLVRIEGDRVTVLKSLPPRPRRAVRVKTAGRIDPTP